MFTIILSEPLQCFSTRRLWIKQRSSFSNPTILTKLQFIRTQELVYIGRRRTKSINESDTRTNKNRKRPPIVNLTRRRLRYQKGVAFLAHPIDIHREVLVDVTVTNRSRCNWNTCLWDCFVCLFPWLWHFNSVSPRTRAPNRGTLLRNRYFTAINSSLASERLQT